MGHEAPALPPGATFLRRRPAGSGQGAGPRIHRGTQWVSQPKGRKKRIPHPSTSLPEPGPCRACLKAVWNCFLLCYFFRTLAVFIGSFHLPTVFDPTWEVQKGPVSSLHCLPRFSTSDGSLALWPHHWCCPHSSAIGLHIAQLLVGTRGTLWEGDGARENHHQRPREMAGAW